MTESADAQESTQQTPNEQGQGTPNKAESITSINGRIREIIDLLPSEGIGFHGTARSVAERFVQEGFSGSATPFDLNDPNLFDDYGNSKNPYEFAGSGSFYYHVEPESARGNLPKVINNFRNAIRDMMRYANREVKKSGVSGDQPVIVIVKMPRRPHQNYQDRYIQERSGVHVAYEPNVISAENVLGYVRLPTVRYWGNEEDDLKWKMTGRITNSPARRAINRTIVNTAHFLKDKLSDSGNIGSDEVKQGS